MARTKEVILKELECPVCFEYMSPPIILCARGHNLCATCRNVLSRCPICSEVFVTNNLALEEVAKKMKTLHNALPHRHNNCCSPLDSLDEHRTKLIIAEEVSRIILTEVKCQFCLNYSLENIYFCVNGHSTCNVCETCTKCAGSVTRGRNFAIETIAGAAEYRCRYRDFGCASILTLQQAQHEEVCEYKPIMCPLFDTVGVRCHWSGTCEDFKSHVVHEHVACKVFEGSFIALNIMYTSNTVMFTLNRMFVLSIKINNGSVFYRIHLEGPPDDVEKYKCDHELLLDGNVISRFEFDPSPKWKEIFMGCAGSTLVLNVRIYKV